jgi:TPR repeat protein
MWLKLTKVKYTYVLEYSTTSQHCFQSNLVYLPMWVLCPLAGDSVYDMLLTDAERLRVVGCVLKCKLVQQLTLGMGDHHKRVCHLMKVSIFKRMASKRMAIVCVDAIQKAEELYASGQCAAALVPLQHAIDMGSISAYAHMAWWYIHGRRNIVTDYDRGFRLAEMGARLGCYHCIGVVGYCYLGKYGIGHGCTQNIALSLKLARESAGRGSKYGQITLAQLHHLGERELVLDWTQGVVFLWLAAKQGLDYALFKLGFMYNYGINCTKDYTEALRLYQLAAAQGHPAALFCIAMCYQKGWGVAADIIEASRWHRRAQEAGHLGML